MKRTHVLKLISILLSLVFTLTGCMTQGASASSGEEGSREVKVGLIYNGTKNDGGWSSSHEAGRIALEDALGIETMFKEAVPETQEVEKVARDMIDSGCNVIFSTSYGYMDYIEKLAREFPDVQFFQCSGNKVTGNLSSYYGRVEDARYLAGMVAGLATKSDKIGYVAAFEIPEVIREINAFTLGAQSVNPEAKVQVTWTHTWYDPAKEKEAASALIDRGCDVIGQHQNTAGAQQAAEEKGVLSVGYHADMSPAAPNANMTSAVWNWGPYYIEAVKQIQAGTYTPEIYWEGLSAGIVDIVPVRDNAPTGAKEQVEIVKAAITAGEFNVFEGPILDQEGNERVGAGEVLSDEMQLTCDWFVQGVEGDIKK
ncbi:MAG: BMP family ABC transporter substrate-binding protein [Cellulosilyticaceae bacterium]